jgi:hypothetical protein
MIDHIGFSVSDYERAKAFYQTALAPLGYSLVMEVTTEQTGHDAAAGFGANGKPDFWIGGEARRTSRRISPSLPRIAPPWMRSTRPRSQPVAAITARPAFARIITPITTARSCATPMVITSRRSVTCRCEFRTRNRNITAHGRLM